MSDSLKLNGFHQPADELLLIVVGSQLTAEIEHRPLAGELQQAIERWCDANVDDDERLRAIVCCDLWYLNQAELAGAPAIAIGDPAINAAAAFLANRLPTAFVVDGLAQVQLDPEFIEPRVCLWGVDTASTGLAIGTFRDRYLDAYLGSLHHLAMP